MNTQPPIPGTESNDPKTAFLHLRANRWSLRSISQKLGIPKSTLFNWESDVVTRRTITVLQSLQLEKLQERYIPSVEEELQKLSNTLARVERALEKQDFEAMRPEFLLRTSLQLRSRLNNLRTDIQPTRTLDTGELPIPLPGCISRAQTVDLDEESSPFRLNGEMSLDPDPSESRLRSEASSPSPLNGERAGVRGEAVREVSGLTDELPQIESAPDSGTKWDKTENSSEPDSSAAATSNADSGTTVPDSESESAPPPAESPRETTPPLTSNHGHERYGDVAVPAIAIPACADELALTAAFQPRDFVESRPAGSLPHG